MDSVTMRALRDEFEKIAITRSVKEWRAADASGDQGTAGSIARASGQLGLKPRYLQDISTGGAEAGVDKMMGHVQNPNTGASNESGVLARKMYKPDSVITRGEFTPQLLQQKQDLTDKARAMSPEAKAMVPDMYGHTTMNAGTPTQRTTSFHEFVPGIHDLRGKNTGTEDKPIWSRGQAARSDLQSIKGKVLDPLENQHGVAMRDTVGEVTSGHNFGNVVGSPQGPKVLDFLPQVGAQQSPAIHSFMKYAPSGDSKFNGGAGGGVGDLRKEVFKPTQALAPSDSGFAHQRMAELMHQANAMPASPTPENAGLRTSVATPSARQISSPLQSAPTSAVTPAARAAAGAVKPAMPMKPLSIHPDPFPSGGTGSFLHGAGAATKGFFGRSMTHL